MLTTTTDFVEGRPIETYLGVVSGEAIMGASIFRTYIDDVRNLSEEHLSCYENELVDAKDRAMRKLRERAEESGADAVVAIDIDYQSIGGESRTMWMVVANGTAVRLR